MILLAETFYFILIILVAVFSVCFIILMAYILKYMRSFKDFYFVTNKMSHSHIFRLLHIDIIMILQN